MPTVKTNPNIIPEAHLEEDKVSPGDDTGEQPRPRARRAVRPTPPRERPAKR